MIHVVVTTQVIMNIKLCVVYAMLHSQKHLRNLTFLSCLHELNVTIALIGHIFNFVQR